MDLMMHEVGCWWPLGLAVPCIFCCGHEWPAGKTCGRSGMGGGQDEWKQWLFPPPLQRESPPHTRRGPQNLTGEEEKADPAGSAPGVIVPGSLPYSSSLDSTGLGLTVDDWAPQLRLGMGFPSLDDEPRDPKFPWSQAESGLSLPASAQPTTRGLTRFLMGWAGALSNQPQNPLGSEPRTMIRHLHQQAAIFAPVTACPDSADSAAHAASAMNALGLGAWPCLNFCY
ncbi:hypothetical protein B0T18DRAFT_387683 [Schizothecium vesticola]|uniref:Uncharacterized protein n=1 Tax=Schizothecium vesticola TaxID=314040 RepID=A0AA40F5I7_9PEZI|nr:hypothetical protein B0T18DRAFT_387683 [Schizothecium vesticola]